MVIIMLKISFIALAYFVSVNAALAAWDVCPDPAATPPENVKPYLRDSYSSQSEYDSKFRDCPYRFLGTYLKSLVPAMRAAAQQNKIDIRFGSTTEAIGENYVSIFISNSVPFDKFAFMAVVEEKHKSMTK